MPLRSVFLPWLSDSGAQRPAAPSTSPALRSSNWRRTNSLFSSGPMTDCPAIRWIRTFHGWPGYAKPRLPTEGSGTPQVSYRPGDLPLGHTSHAILVRPDSIRVGVVNSDLRPDHLEPSVRKERDRAARTPKIPATATRLRRYAPREAVRWPTDRKHSRV